MARKCLSPDSNAPIVVKLGGSLYYRVADLAPVLLASRRPLLIVPGGGIFADAVRSTRVDDDPAHWMAIASMDQYGWFIASQGIPVTGVLQKPDRTAVFLPYCSMRQSDPLPHSWDVTSDSIAAWIADFLQIDLLILKSVDGISENGRLVNQVSHPVNTEVVDPFLIPFILKKKVQTTIINGTRVDRIEKFLMGMSIPGTRIGTTF